jgi:hypothetical protein
VAVCVRKLMAEGGNWVGTALYLLRAFVVDDVSSKGGRVPKNPGVLAGAASGIEDLGVRTRSEGRTRLHATCKPAMCLLSLGHVAALKG